MKLCSRTGSRSVLGLISYPLYLWHWPLLSLLRNVDRALSPTTTCAAVVASILLAAVTWRLVERPLASLPLPRVATMLCAGLASLMLATTVTRAAARTEANELVNADCLHRYPYRTRGLWFCMMNRDAPPTVLLLGDSHAHHLYPGLIESVPQETILAIGACAPTSGLRFPVAADAENTCANDNFNRQSAFLNELVAQRTRAALDRDGRHVAHIRQ